MKVPLRLFSSSQRHLWRVALWAEEVVNHRHNNSHNKHLYINCMREGAVDRDRCYLLRCRAAKSVTGQHEGFIAN